MANPFRQNELQFTHKFAQSIISWNNVEWAAQRILGSFIGGGVGSFVVLHHLKNVALQDALIATADLLTDPRTPASSEVAEHVLHFVEGFDRLRVYRNFYVHSVKALGRDKDDKDQCVGVIQETESKKRVAWISHRLTYAELSTFLNHVTELEHYGDAVAAYVNPPNALSGLRAPALPLSSLEKPTWPGTLKKSRTYPSKLPPPPEASPE